MTQAEKNLWAQEIAAALNSRFDLTVRDATVIELGWINIKWKMDTDRGPVFVKFYHPDRYRLHQRPDRREEMERTLRLQHGLNEAGVPCPKVYSHEHRFLQETSGGLWFAASDWVEGRTVPAGSMTTSQMHDLGQAAGRMHAWLRSVPPLSRPAWEPDREAYMREWEVNRQKALETGDETVIGWLNRSREIVQSMDFSRFETCPTGWLHWDLWVDNLLLQGERLAGIVDFDRMTMAYPGIDVARAVLSGALRDGNLRTEAVRSFMKGYRTYSEMPRGLLSRSMQMLYLVESIWWLRTEVRRESGLRALLGRFIEEMHWIEDRWNVLPDLLDEV
ncbi:phosphotransferase enzyme family protein [Cohnella caldifontis]|uniref:phosphotransferase enzyme family protein n=1 Tax=Cohnella caldifontis TaxID=3027471 RepID=UPI0023ED5EBA|nr:phosphotransferase [Cohnella sp. YIM B05605]